MIKKRKLATLFLMLGTFFNPLGYDALLHWMIKVTGGYWNGIFVFYLVSALCFILYFLLANKNPLSYMRKNFKKKRLDEY